MNIEMWTAAVIVFDYDGRALCLNEPTGMKNFLFFFTRTIPEIALMGIFFSFSSCYPRVFVRMTREISEQQFVC
jgi:hypothetical protein